MEWARRPLAQLAFRISDGSHNPPKGVELSNFMMLSSKNVFDDQLSFRAPRYLSAADFKAEDRRTSVTAGDVLLTIVGTIGRAAVVPADAPSFTLQRSVAVIRPDSSVVDSRFLMYALISGSDALNSQARGVAQKGIYLEALREFCIDHPPVAEQRRIVTILDEAFEGIASAKANAEKNLQNAQAVFESHREALLSSAGQDWGEAPLRDLCDIKHGYAFEGEFFAQEGDYVLLTPGNYFESGGYRERGEKQKYFTGPIPRDYILVEGSLLVAMTEQAAGLLGSPLLVPESDRFLHNQRLGLVVSRPGAAWVNDFFFHVFNLRRVRAEIHASASGVKVRHTSPSKIGAVRVMFPRSEVEQRLIATKLADLERRCAQMTSVYRRKLNAFNELKKSLLSRAFSGQL